MSIHVSDSSDYGDVLRVYFLLILAKYGTCWYPDSNVEETISSIKTRKSGTVAVEISV